MNSYGFTIQHTTAGAMVRLTTPQGQSKRFLCMSKRGDVNAAWDWAWAQLHRLEAAEQAFLEEQASNLAEYRT